MIDLESVRAGIEAELAGMSPKAREEASQWLGCLKPLSRIEFAKKYLGDGTKGWGRWGMVHRRMEEEVDAARAAGRHLLLLVSRDHSKTTLFNIIDNVMAALYYHPNNRKYLGLNPPIIDITSRVETNPKDWLSTIAGILLLPDINRDFPWATWGPDEDLTGRDKLAKKIARNSPSEGIIELKNGALIRIWGSKSMRTGAHSTKITYDDWVDRLNTQYPEQMHATEQLFKSTRPIRSPGCTSTVIGTTYTPDDLYAYIESTGEYAVVRIPAIEMVEGGGCASNVGHSISDIIEYGHITYPEKFSREEYRSIFNELGPYVFASQYLLEPIPDEDQIFKADWIQVGECPYSEGIVTIAVDPAISDQDEACFTSIVAVRHVRLENGDVRRYVIDFKHDRRLNDPNRTVDATLDMCERWRPVAVAIEMIGYQKALDSAFKNEMSRRGREFNIVPITSHGRESKKMRIKGLQPFFARGEFVIHPGHTALLDQIKHFPKTRSIDALDALSLTLHLDEMRKVMPAGIGDKTRKARAHNSAMRRRKKIGLRA